MFTHVLGLDLSLTSTGCALAPLAWEGDWHRVETWITGSAHHEDADEHDRIFRCVEISEFILDRLGHRVTTTLAVPEWYVNARRNMMLPIYTGELGGIVRLGLMRAGAQVMVHQLASTRKLLLGPQKRASGRGETKARIVAALRDAGCPFAVPKSIDLCDAFVQTNWGLHVTGSFHLHR